MANPFGAAVDDDKLDQIVRYVDKQKTQEDRAREAMNLINEEGKDTKAQTYLDSVKEYYGSGVSTLCLIYNATGDTLYYVTDRDWFGFVGRTPYPPEIGNGQWAAFQHVHKTDDDNSGSEAAVVYRGKNKYGDNRDIIIAWSTPSGALNQNKAYCDVGAENSFEGQSCWEDLREKVNKSGYTHSIDRDGVKIEVDTSRGSVPVFHAIIKIPFSP